MAAEVKQTGSLRSLRVQVGYIRYLQNCLMTWSVAKQRLQREPRQRDRRLLGCNTVASHLACALPDRRQNS
jgi:hypothetical protein